MRHFFVLHARQIIQEGRLCQPRTVILGPGIGVIRCFIVHPPPAVIADGTPDREVMRDVHLNLCSIPTMRDHTFLIGIQIHAEYRTDTHLEDLVFGQNMQTRIRQREVGNRRDPLRHVPMPVRVINRECVQLQRIILQVKLQIVLLSLTEQRVFTLRFSQHTGDSISRIRLDCRIGGDYSISCQFFDEVINLRILNRLRDALCVDN